ncbi:major facilitator superfamily domain-containing protein, partial [Chytriomyces sp. MP71]
MTGETESTPLLVNAERDEPDFREHRLADVRTLGVSFFFLFGTQSTIATLSSTLLPPSVAFFSYGSLYLSFALFNALAAARIVSLLGVRKSLFVAAITYLLWSIANVLALKYAYYSVLVPVAVLNGLGASVLWTAQSLYLARCALPQTLGAYSGAFFACMWASGIIGPLFSSSLLRANVDKVSVFEAVIAISLISLLLLAYLWLARPEPSNPGNPVHEDALSGDVDLLATARLLVHPSMLLLMPLSYIIGFEQAFYGSSLPLFIKTDHPQADLSTKLYLRAALGFVITMTALMIGRVTDKFGSRPW